MLRLLWLRHFAIFASALLLLAARSYSQTPPTPTAPTSLPTEERLKNLEAQINALQQDLAKFRFENTVPEPIAEEFLGEGPAMSKAYFSNEPLSIAAAAEFLLHLRDDATDSGGITDLKTFLGYRLSTQFVFQSSFAVHVSPPDHQPAVAVSREPYMDFAMIDWIIRERFVLRAGLIPVPLGLRRLRPEPTLHVDPVRPRVEEWIVPFDLSRPGLVAAFEKGPVRVHAGVIATPELGRFQNGTFIEGSGSRFRPPRFDAADDFASVLRIEGGWRWNQEKNGIDVAFSRLDGNSSHRTPGIPNAPLEITEAHLRAQFGVLQFTALGADGRLGNTAAIETFAGVRPGSRALGWNLTGYADLYRSPRPASLLDAGVFVTNEGIELKDGGGLPGTVPTDRIGRALRAGIQIKPVPNVVLKMARQWRLANSSLDDDVWQIALGAVF